MLKKRKKILSFLTAAVLAAALLPATTIVTSADNGNIIFEDNFTTGFDFSANGYTTPGNSTLEAEGLKISTGLGQVTSFSKNLSTPITTGRTVLEIEFKFDPLKIWVDGNHGGINYNFPDITSSDNVRYAATNLTGETSKLANTAIVDGVIYKYAVDFDITAPENGGSYKTYNVHLYKKNQSGTWDEIARVLGKTINAGFYDSITKDIGKIGFTIGGEDQVMYLYALKAYTLSAENLIYEEPYLYKAGTAYTDKYGNGEYFQADGKPEYTNNSLKISTWSASAESGEDGKPLIPANGGNVRPGIPHIDAVDNLTVETTFTTGNIVLNKADWFMVLTSHPYSQHSPFRANIVNGALNYSNGVSNFPIGSALLPNKSYTLKTIMNFTSQTLDVYLLNVENNKIMYKNNFPFSYSSHNSGGVSGTWENLGFDYLVYNFGDNGSNTKDNPGVMYLDNIKITVSSQETEADTNIIINDTYDEFDEGYVPTTVQGYSGINAQNIAVDSEGRLKISRTPGEVGGWIRTLPETVDSGKVVAEFEFEFENDPVKVTSYAFPAVRATDGAGLIQPQIVNEKELKPNGETAYILAGGIKYRQVFVIDFDGESVKRYIYNLTSGAIEICNIRDISGLTVKNFTDLQFLLTNDDTAVQNLYIDNLKVYRIPELNLEGISYNGVEIEDGGILSGTADYIDVKFGQFLAPETVSNINLVPVPSGGTKTVTLLDDRKTARVSFGTPFEYSQTYNLYIPAAVTNLAGISSDLPLIQRVFTTGADPDAPANDVVVVDSRYFSTGNYGYNYYVTIKNGFAGHKSGVIIIAQYFGGKLVDVKMLPFDNLTGKTESDELLVGNFNIKDKQPSTFTAYVWDGADNLSPYTTATALPTP